MFKHQVQLPRKSTYQSTKKEEGDSL